MRNELTHEKRPPPTESSRRFLYGYISSLLCLHQYPSGDVVKGKMVLNALLSAYKANAEPKEELRWGASFRPQVWQEVI